MDVYDHVASQIRRLREEFGGKGLSQETVAQAVGVTTNTISRWETATYHPGIGDLEKLARFFKVSILDFLPRTELDNDERLGALLRAAKELDAGDLDELRKYAEFRRARHMLETRPGKRRGRKPKG